MLTYQREMGTAIVDEAMPLLRRHWMEVEAAMGEQLDPDLVAIKSAIMHGDMRVYSVRDDGKLVGYLAFLLSAGHLHYAKVKLAMQDVLYVEPAHRGAASILLMLEAERDLRAAGIDLVGQVEKVRAPLGKLLSRLGYQHEENLWIKRLRAADSSTAMEA